MEHTKESSNALSKIEEKKGSDHNGDQFFAVMVLFPDELKIVLLSFIDAPSLARMARVNRKFSELMKSSLLWKLRVNREFELSALPTRFSSWKEAYFEYSTPLEKDSNFKLCCYGYLGEHNAVSKLKNETPGTFLFRSSSTDPQAITISYFADDNTIKHRRLHRMPYPFPGYTFQLPSYKHPTVENVCYKNYFQLLSQNRDWMRKPLVLKQQTEESKLVLLKKSKIDIHCKDGPPSSAEIHSIAQALKNNSTAAIELCISANLYYRYKIGFDDLITLIRALEENTTLNVLGINHMHLNQHVCDAIAKLLSITKSLTHLSLFHCTFESNAISVILEALSTTSLGNLTLNQRNLDPKTVKERDFTSFECRIWECAK
eukprot:TRINITY_DN15649_c0_g1_i1.p2 TRINITY_DN15649_c0_g1~~TRINITY_DN15649_c0_g1_i1.p2  ORF type:complete len:374 (-),score=80.23 TRINITY_DN15649_c0_g1_i1:20-1141(-)